MIKLNSSTTPSELAQILGTTYSKLKYFYYQLHISNCYTDFEISKKSGGSRLIEAPDEKLKLIQSRLAKLLNC